MLTKTRLIGVVGLACVFLSGCGASPTPDARTTTSPETVTLYVKDMGERLNLL